MRYLLSSLLLFLTVLLCNPFHAQDKNLVFVDKEGVLRWTNNKKEASFFGVNYTVPFAYGYRSHKALGKDLKKAIDEDVYHFNRLGLDAFRVHMWDVEITDSLGNLLENDHLDLFDYLLYQLQLRNIKTLITPIAFWGNGYPERDEKTPGFSTVYGKGPSVVKEEAIKAQENYLQQILQHVNPYTKKTYKDDQQIIAIEINNEPHHSGPKEKATDYVNRMAAAVRSTGWTKPIFYNISESPSYADAIAKANVDGHSFQWYPSGLVANYEQKGNFLPHVDRYTIPFDSIKEYRNKARMVYEFDAADILPSYMYPAMARSYRTAGFQWCTQFAYDPLATAYGNTEYQTHYLNLAYTPSKAISMLIAAKVFQRVPRLKSYGSYPTDTLFDVFRVSYKNSLGEMNSDEEFYYSNSTDTKPKAVAKLKHIAGVGHSAIVYYEGTGAYFLDKTGEGIWRLEVMPDAIVIRDPFERASPKKEVVRIQWQPQLMKILLPELGENFEIAALNEGNSWVTPVDSNKFMIMPGVYELSSKNLKKQQTSSSNNTPVSKEFIAPEPFASTVSLFHVPFIEVSAGKTFTIAARAAGLDPKDKVSLELRTTPRWRNIVMERGNAGEYYAAVPAESVVPGILNYRIIVQKANNDHYVFPGNHKGDPYAWDNPSQDSWQTIVAGDKTALEIYNTNTDRTNLVLYNPDWRNNFFRYVPSDKASQLVTKITAANLGVKQMMGLQFYFGDKLRGRETELSSFKTLVVRFRAERSVNASISLITTDALCFSANLPITEEWTELRIPFDKFQPDSMLLLPRPYPGFLPLWFRSGASGPLNVGQLEKMQIICHGEGKQTDIEIASVWLENRK